MKNTTLTSIGLIAVLASCTPHLPASPAPEQLPETPSQAESPTPTRPYAIRWSFSPRHNTNSYRSISEAVITQLDASSFRRDSTNATAEFTLDVNYQSTLTKITGRITTLATSTNSFLHLPLVFSATISSGRFNLDVIPQLHDELCNTDTNQSLGEIRSVLYTLPTEFDSNSTWSDSTSTTTCSGRGLPTTLQLIRSYKVIGEGDYNGQVLLLLNREDQIQLSGQGAQEQHQLHLEGSGIATSRITIDAQTGVLIAMERREQLEITIRASGQLQKFKQTTHQQIHVVR